MQKGVLEIHTDGGSRGNPGPAASAFVAEIDGKHFFEGSKFIGKETNNVAEYQAVLLALKWLTEEQANESFNEIIFYLDSELVVRQLQGKYKVKSEGLISLHQNAKALIDKVNPKITFISVPREKNKQADLLVNETLDKNS